MGRYARSKGKAASCKGYGRRGGKTKTKVRDLDQIKADLANVEGFKKALDTTHPYCMECARFFQSDEILMQHTKSKAHKHRLRKLKDWPTGDDHDHDDHHKRPELQQKSASESGPPICDAIDHDDARE